MKTDYEEVQKTAEMVVGYMRKSHKDDIRCMVKAGDSDCHGGEWGMDIEQWDWNPGVGLIALSYYSEAVNNEEIVSYLVDWEARNREKSSLIPSVNATAPYAIYPFLYEHTGNSGYLEIAKKHAEWLLLQAPKTSRGGIQHTVNSADSVERLSGQIWADTVFMAVLFLARLARVTKNARYAEAAAEQLAIHIRVLRDEKTGVLYHGFQCGDKSHMSGALWARGNAWLACGFPMILREIDGLAWVPDDVMLKYREMMESLAIYQEDNGLWHTVVNRPDFYCEGSGSAGIACGILMAVHEGILNSDYTEYADAAYKGLKRVISTDGAVEHVSGGTPIMPTIEEYNCISCYPCLYGQGLILLFLSELMM